MKKKILLGITGGIAAYKCPELVRQLKKADFDVRVVLTKSAKEFVSALSLQVVSEHKVLDDLFNDEAELAMSHIELAKWADLILIAPASANTIAKIACGIADNLLTTLCLASASKIAIAPAMNQQMYKAIQTQQSISKLKQNGVHFFGPASGEQACKDVGLGRMLEPHELTQLCSQLLSEAKPLSHLHIAITAGPTQEQIDPVRYLSNYSSGKMGYALADAAAKLGAKVTLISGPVAINALDNVDKIDVKTALEMHQNALSIAPKADIFIACAAVADYRVKQVEAHKIKKQHDKDEWQLTLIKNPDIVFDVASLKQNRPFVVGFAAETQNIESYAQQKLHKKNLDMICANDVSQSYQGFGSDNNSMTIYTKSSQTVLPLANKNAIAKQLLEVIVNELTKKAEQ